MKTFNSLTFFSVVFSFLTAFSPQLLAMPSATDASDEETSTDAAEPAKPATTQATPTAEPITPPKTEMPSAEHPADPKADTPATPTASAEPPVEPTQFKTMDLEGASGKQLTSATTNPKELQEQAAKANELQTNMQTILNTLEKTRTTCQETFHTVASPLDSLLPEVSSLLGKYEKQVPSSNP